MRISFFSNFSVFPVDCSSNLCSGLSFWPHSSNTDCHSRVIFAGYYGQALLRPLPDYLPSAGAMADYGRTWGPNSLFSTNFSDSSPHQSHEDTTMVSIAPDNGADTI